jgi:hypothetical protein
MGRMRRAWILAVAAGCTSGSVYVHGSGDPPDPGAPTGPTWPTDPATPPGPDTGPTAPDDVDGDGFTADEDCDDGDDRVYPGATERCGDADFDCDGLSGDEDPDALDPVDWYPDADGDGAGAPDGATAACTAPHGHVAAGSDCDDTDDTVFPGADEAYDGVDNDCDLEIDEGWSVVALAPDPVASVWATHCGGDTEFASNGPQVDVVATFANRGDRVELLVEADWLETQADWTCGVVSLQRDTGLVVDVGCEVVSLASSAGVSSEVELSESLSYVDDDIFTDDLSGQGLIDRLLIQGDGVGDDIGTGSNDAHIESLSFGVVDVLLHCP